MVDFSPKEHEWSELKENIRVKRSFIHHQHVQFASSSLDFLHTFNKRTIYLKMPLMLKTCKAEIHGTAHKHNSNTRLS